MPTTDSSTPLEAALWLVRQADKQPMERLAKAFRSAARVILEQAENEAEVWRAWTSYCAACRPKAPDIRETMDQAA